MAHVRVLSLIIITTDASLFSEVALLLHVTTWYTVQVQVEVYLSHIIIQGIISEMCDH